LAADSDDVSALDSNHPGDRPALGRWRRSRRRLRSGAPSDPR